ncbi:MAG: branched-chain amino acid ABC transporter permease [Myxococcota bacterium]|nr:branched-chain amino acid ABC transporter permease [Myxococcota bacterium]
MATFTQLLTSGLALGAIYALIALGFVVIYRASQVFNFAHGELLAFGALMTVSLSKLGMPWALAVALAMVATGLLGAFIERVALRPLLGRPVFVTIMVTIFIGMILRALLHMAWGTDPRGMPTPWDPMAKVEVGGAVLWYNSLAAVGTAALGLAVFFVLLRKTRLGVAMRATASDQETSLALGIPVGRVFALTWFLAGMYAALAGVFLGMFPRNVDVELGYVALRAFPAVIVGGLESPVGAVVAGVTLGILEVMAQGYLNPLLGQFGQNFHEVFPYVIMVLVLVVRPYGLFGQKTVRRV